MRNTPHQNQQHPHETAPEPVEISSGRLEAFSDGVFAIAITLLILDIHVPATGRLLDGLVHEWPAYCAYVVSFLIIGMVWMNHHTMMFYIRRVDRTLLMYNLLLLMNVAFIPFPTHVLAQAMNTGNGERTAAVFYGLTLTLGGIPFNALWIYASRGHRHLGNMITPAQATVMRRHFMMGPVMYLGATLVGLASAVASLTIFGVLLLFYMIEVLGSSNHDQQNAEARPPVKAMAGLADPQEGAAHPPAAVNGTAAQSAVPSSAAPSALPSAAHGPATHTAPAAPVPAAVAASAHGPAAVHAVAHPSAHPATPPNGTAAAAPHAPAVAPVPVPAARTAAHASATPATAATAPAAESAAAPTLRRVPLAAPAAAAAPADRTPVPVGAEAPGGSGERCVSCGRAG